MIQIHSLTPNFGADITGVDLNTITDTEFAAVYRAWLDYGVLRFRDQTLDQEGLQRFSRRFGPLEERPVGRMGAAEKAKIENIYVTVLSNIVEDGKPIGGLGNAEAAWHSDMTYVETPPPASVLLGVLIPAAGGDTWFADQNAAYEALPADLKARITDVRVKHNAAHNSVGGMRPGFTAFDDPRDAPGAVHPMVATHPETGHRCLYLGRRDWAYVDGFDLAESEALLDEVWAYAALPEHRLRQVWQPGDVVIWDNRRCLHRRDGFPADEKRLMYRCQVLQENQRSERRAIP